MRNISKRPFDDFDEHNQITEPMAAIILSPELPRNGNGPAGNLPETPRVYPVLSPSRPAYPRRSSFPVVVGALLVGVQIVLLARVVLLLFGVSSNMVVVELVYAAGGLFAWPFHILLERFHFPAQFGLELINYLAALVAILVYGVLARILVRFLKALLHSR